MTIFGKHTLLIEINYQQIWRQFSYNISIYLHPKLYRLMIILKIEVRYKVLREGTGVNFQVHLSPVYRPPVPEMTFETHRGNKEIFFTIKAKEWHPAESLLVHKIKRNHTTLNFHDTITVYTMKETLYIFKIYTCEYILYVMS